MSLSCLPKSAQGIIYRAKTEGWRGKKRAAQGGGVEYDITSFPDDMQSEIRTRAITSLLCDAPSAPEVPATPLNPGKTKPDTTLDLLRQCPSLLSDKLVKLSDLQRTVADARAALVNEVLRLESTGLSRIKAMKAFIELVNNGTLPERLQPYVRNANARRGANRTIGLRSLNTWVCDYLRATDAAERLALLAPGYKPVKPVEKIDWLPLFLSIYRTPNGISIQEAYRQFCAEWDTVVDVDGKKPATPSYSAVLATLKKLPRITRQRGRVTGTALRALLPYVKRDWSQLSANDVWVGDGHGLKMKVAHPEHGQPFIPEITLIMDGVTRYVVGWSVSLSENTIAVADALRHGMSKNGVPLFYYSDNGGGEKNHLFDADITGILPRLGVIHETGIPGNPQGRGIIERAHKTILYRVAQQFATYHGTGADRDNVRITSRSIASAVNAQKQSKELTTSQRPALAKLPSWNQLLDAIEAGVEWYNTQHEHSELPKRDGHHMTPSAYRAERLEADKTELHFLSELELRDSFMPQVVRVAQRGWLSVFNNEYFAEDLIYVDGERVSVAFDIHDASRVIVRRLDGTFVCEAIFNGNKRAAFPVAYVEKARKDRAERRLSMVEKKAAEIRAELSPVINIEQDFSSLLSGQLKQQVNEQEPEPFFLFESERDEWRAQHAKQLKAR